MVHKFITKNKLGQSFRPVILSHCHDLKQMKYIYQRHLVPFYKKPCHGNSIYQLTGIIFEDIKLLSIYRNTHTHTDLSHPPPNVRNYGIDIYNQGRSLYACAALSAAVKGCTNFPRI